MDEYLYKEKYPRSHLRIERLFSRSSSTPRINTEPCLYSVPKAIDVVSLSKEKNKANKKKLKVSPEMRKFIKEARDISVLSRQEEPKSVSKFSSSILRLSGADSPSVSANVRTKEKFKHNMTPAEKNVLSVGKVIMTPIPTQVVLSKSKFGTFSKNSPRTTTHSRMKQRRASFEEEMPMFDEECKSHFAFILRKHKITPRSIPSSAGDEINTKTPKTSKKKTKPVPILLPEIKEEREKKIYKEMRQILGVDLSQKLFKQHFAPTPQNLEKIEKELQEEDPEVIQVPIKCVNLTKDRAKNMQDKGKAELMPPLSPKEKVGRVKSYGRWYLPPNQFNSKIRSSRLSIN